MGVMPPRAGADASMGQPVLGLTYRNVVADPCCSKSGGPVAVVDSGLHAGSATSCRDVSLKGVGGQTEG